MNNINRYPENHPNRQGPVLDDLVLPRLREWRHGIQSKILSAFCRSLGITAVKFHDLRATFITNLLAQGVPLVKVMAIVGHAEMSTTNEYLRLAGVDVKDDTTDRLAYRLHDDSKGNVVHLYKDGQLMRSPRKSQQRGF
ncbi:MAG: tyrosine-type recombinase/integrase [Bacteriovoracales bacterium]|nr:tyrosine-type recombinase/integrase [Bacteriovoracales bacterium]